VLRAETTENKIRSKNLICQWYFQRHDKIDKIETIKKYGSIRSENIGDTSNMIIIGIYKKM
jgi:hypothetical protein